MQQSVFGKKNIIPGTFNREVFIVHRIQELAFCIIRYGNSLIPEKYPPNIGTRVKSFPRVENPCPFPKTTNWLSSAITPTGDLIGTIASTYFEYLIIQRTIVF